MHFLEHIRLATVSTHLLDGPVVEISLKIAINNVRACLTAASFLIDGKSLTLGVTARVKSHILVIAKEALHRMIRAHVKCGSLKPFIASNTVEIDYLSVHLPENHWPFKFFSRPEELNEFVSVPGFVNRVLGVGLAGDVDVDNFDFFAFLPIPL